MTDIKLYNTMAREKQVFTPIDPKNVRMYVCGPTVYDRAHLGNARPVVVFDVLYRLLRHVYGPDHVTYVRNFTDVDDKINATALQRKEAGAEGTLEELVHERSNETIGWYLQDMGALGALEPDEMPRATEFVGPMIAMIEDLIAKGHAYEAEGHVLFAVESYKNYGRLSGRSVDDMIAGARVEVAPYKKNPMDFVLWKPSTDDLPGWDSPWGRGRPGWHIECSAMSYELLGATFDIHGGGNDLQFPHHENEIAQSKCAHPDAGFANYWLHNEMLQVEGKKMSKSLGNFFTVHDLLEQGVPGEVIRFVFLGTHYRKPMDWTEKKAEQAFNTVRRWQAHAQAVGFGERGEGVGDNVEVIPGFVEALSDDLNTSLALTLLDRFEREYLREENVELDMVAQFSRSLRLIGLDGKRKDQNAFPEEIAAQFDKASAWSRIGTMIDAARTEKNFDEADRIRDAAKAAGFEVHTTKDGTILSETLDSDYSKLEGL
ncbi:cysteine--tRNA ligase [Aliiroseovarius sediminis]|uniref:cysteine--tRNA ligase n=1 Tax=Aliiroseovarius sediminis TaxID=2925839 RepID=UPI001F59CB29|nr:cysteine--tRNA ligase [Aliiroseovarius sediminis]MCI2393150.1 cysteine--tRNA ligase [Aliiroseovarius sediminis]